MNTKLTVQAKMKTSTKIVIKKQKTIATVILEFREKSTHCFTIYKMEH